MPKNYDIAGNLYFETSTSPVYTMNVANSLHPKEVDEESEETYLIETKVITNPIPQDFSKASIDLLD